MSCDVLVCYHFINLLCDGSSRQTDTLEHFDSVWFQTPSLILLVNEISALSSQLFFFVRFKRKITEKMLKFTGFSLMETPVL